MRRNDRYRLLSISFVSIQFGLACSFAWGHSDVFLAQVGGKVAIGGANELGTVDEHFDLETRVFEGVMIPSFPPFAPADYGRDEPGFHALSRGHSALPAGVSTLPAGAAVTVNLAPFLLGGASDTLFYWDGSGAVSFQPAAVAQPGVAMSLDANTIGNAGITGGLDLHPAFKLDNGGPGVPSDGAYLVAPIVSVTGLADSDRFFMLWLVDALLVDEDAAEELEESLEMGQTVVHGKDFGFFEEAVEFVRNNVVPEPSGAMLGWLALAGLPAMMARRRYRLSGRIR